VNAQSGLPTIGYALERVYSNDLRLCDKPVPPNQQDDEGEIAFGWDWRMIEKDRFEVKVILSVEPAGIRDELARVVVVGRFQQVADTPTVELSDFVKRQAPAILMPYARQLISLLTSNSIYGAFFLPPLNLAEMMKDFDASQAQGAKQVRAVRSTRKTKSKSGQRSKPTNPQKHSKRKGKS
jgi:preprotein translocase subunit SecB